MAGSKRQWYACSIPIARPRGRSMPIFHTAGQTRAAHVRRTACAGLMLGLLSLQAGTGWAAPAPEATDPKKFQSYLYSDAYRAALAAAWKKVPPVSLPACGSLTDGNVSVTLQQDVAFDAKGLPKSGAWWGHYPVSGCGAERIINILFRAEPSGVRFLVTLPGRTRANIVLQRDGLTYAFIGAGTKVRDCKTMEVADTAFDGFGLSSSDKKAPESGPWRETWTVAACGRMLAVPLEFIPDATGTTINQRPADVRELTK